MDRLLKIKSFGELFLNLLNGSKKDVFSEELNSRILNAKSYNRWFTEENVLLRLNSICNYLISDQFTKDFSFVLDTSKKNHRIALFSEERIPLEEFPSLLAILLKGNSFIYKTNELSDKLLPYFFELLGESVTDYKQRISFTDRPIKNADKYFFTLKNDNHPELHKYFGNKNTFFEARYQSVAILSGTESAETLNLLGRDIVSFYGLGTGNVRKIYVPKGFDLTVFFRAIESWRLILDQSTYANNYQYYKTIYLINRVPHFDNGFMLFKEDASFRAPVSVLFYEYYDEIEALMQKLNRSNEITFIYASHIPSKSTIPFGESVNQLLSPSENLIKYLQ